MDLHKAVYFIKTDSIKDNQEENLTNKIDIAN